MLTITSFSEFQTKGERYCSTEGFTFEQIYFYERAANHKAKEPLFESFKCANFLGKHPDAVADQGFLERGFICLKDVAFSLWILSYLSYIFYENEIIWSHRDKIISFS